MPDDSDQPPIHHIDQSVQGDHSTSIGYVEGDVHIHHSSASQAAQPSPLPSKTYGRFVGREQEFTRILGELQKPDRMQMIALYGMGGIGKTVLARELAAHCAQQRLYDALVWISAKEEFFVGSSVRTVVGERLSLESVLHDIARQTGQLDIINLPLKDCRQAIARTMQQTRLLIVLDNLESVPDAPAIVAELYDLIGTSQLLITSRHQIDHDLIQAHWLAGLDSSEGVEYLKTVEGELNVTRVAQEHDPLQTRLFLHQKTGGAPLAMRLVVGQLSTQPLDVVTHMLEKGASWDARNYKFYAFTYQGTWNQLSRPAQFVLVAMAHFEPNLGGTAEAVFAVAAEHVTQEDIPPALDQLVRTSLVQVGGSVQHTRYALHPLTWYFVMGDIIQEEGVVKPWA